LEVFMLSLLAGLLEIGRFSQFIVAPYCAQVGEVGGVG
jgi:hypothetical protein